MYYTCAYSVVKLLSHVGLFTTSWIAGCQASLTTAFPKQKYWSGLSFPYPEDLPDLGIEPESPAL